MVMFVPRVPMRRLLMTSTTHGMLSQEINQWLTVMHNNQANDEK
jgi:hypothetical protein